ncbi:MAG: hypothetical protein GC191_05560 [Azospirillum sp.]|nr:hypothetical protein [Azospirillum sp.]
MTRMARFYRRLGGARSEDTGESEYHSGGGEPMDLEAYEAQRARVRAAARERVLASMEDPIDPQLRGSQQRGAGVQSADGTETRPSGAIAADRVAAQRNGSGEPPRRQERQASLIRLARRL